jgi:transcriptional regulator with XRE-family HTH domain
MEKLREFLREEMQRQGLTEWEIQKRAGGKITDSYIKDILNGKTKSIGVDKLNALAKGLRADSLELFKLASGQGIVTRKKDQDPWTARGLVRVIDRILVNPDLIAILKAILSMKPAKLKAVLRFIESNKK